MQMPLHAVGKKKHTQICARSLSAYEISEEVAHIIKHLKKKGF